MSDNTIIMVSPEQNMKNFRKNPLLNNDMLPVDIVLHPSWWYRHEGITFDEDFYYHPAKRVESERKMEKVLYERFGRWGMGAERGEDRPEVGPVHLAAGFILSEMLGCRVEYKENSAPQVIPADTEELAVDAEGAFSSAAFRRFRELTESLKSKHGRVTGDINWSGVLNTALDLRGQRIFMDLFDRGDVVKEYFAALGRVTEKFTDYVQGLTGTSSISVNRNVKNVEKGIFLHSECSHTMISVEDYEKYLFPLDEAWSRSHRPYGIHYCGEDPHRFAESYSRLPHLDFLDVGWGGDVAAIRKHLPHTFLNIRLSPVELISMSEDEIRETVTRLVRQSGEPYLTGVCCINIDHQVEDPKIAAICESVERLKGEYQAGKIE